MHIKSNTPVSKIRFIIFWLPHNDKLKIFEKLLEDKFRRIRKISNSQFGFGKGKFCSDAVFITRTLQAKYSATRLYGTVWGRQNCTQYPEKPYKRGSPIYIFIYIHSRKSCTRHIKTTLRETIRGGFYY